MPRTAEQREQHALYERKYRQDRSAAKRAAEQKVRDDIGRIADSLEAIVAILSDVTVTDMGRRGGRGRVIVGQ